MSGSPNHLRAGLLAFFRESIAVNGCVLITPQILTEAQAVGLLDSQGNPTPATCQELGVPFEPPPQWDGRAFFDTEALVVGHHWSNDIEHLETIKDQPLPR